MIYSTDVQSAHHDFGGSDGAELLVVSGARLKSVNLVPPVNKNSFVEFYDLDDDTGTLDVTKRMLSLVSGAYASTMSGGIWIRIPGNGIRFSTGIVARATTSDIGGDETQFITIVYQGAIPD